MSLCCLSSRPARKEGTITFRRSQQATHKRTVPGIYTLLQRKNIGLLKDAKEMSCACHSGLSGIFLRKDSRQTGVTENGASK
jgi:hypothetical protein